MLSLNLNCMPFNISTLMVGEYLFDYSRLLAGTEHLSDDLIYSFGFCWQGSALQLADRHLFLEKVIPIPY